MTWVGASQALQKVDKGMVGGFKPRSRSRTRLAATGFAGAVDEFPPVYAAVNVSGTQDAASFHWAAANMVIRKAKGDDKISAAFREDRPDALLPRASMEAGWGFLLDDLHMELSFEERQLIQSIILHIRSVAEESGILSLNVQDR